MTIPTFSFFISLIFYMSKYRLPYRYYVFSFYGFVFWNMQYILLGKKDNYINTIVFCMVLMLILPFVIKLFLFLRKKIGDFI